MKTTLSIRIEYSLLHSSHLLEITRQIALFHEKLLTQKIANSESYFQWFCDFCINLIQLQRTSDSKSLGLKYLHNLMESVNKRNNLLCKFIENEVKTTSNCLDLVQLM
jgi:hypothetical protein